MNQQFLDPRRIDALEFSRLKAQAEWQVPFSQLPRLYDCIEQVTAESEGDAGLRVRAQGASGPSGQSLIEIEVSGRVALRCQACLGLVEWDIDSELTLELTSDPARLEAEPDLDEPYEPVLVSRPFDLLAEAESEALLCLPYIPRHEVCPEVLPVSDGSVQAEVSEKRSPFAALAALKKS